MYFSTRLRREKKNIFPGQQTDKTFDIMWWGEEKWGNGVPAWARNVPSRNRVLGVRRRLNLKKKKTVFQIFFSNNHFWFLLARVYNAANVNFCVLYVKYQYVGYRSVNSYTEWKHKTDYAKTHRIFTYKSNFTVFMRNYFYSIYVRFVYSFVRGVQEQETCVTQWGEIRLLQKCRLSKCRWKYSTNFFIISYRSYIERLFYLYCVSLIVLEARAARYWRTNARP